MNRDNHKTLPSNRENFQNSLRSYERPRSNSRDDYFELAQRHLTPSQTYIQKLRQNTMKNVVNRLTTTNYNTLDVSVKSAEKNPYLNNSMYQSKKTKKEDYLNNSITHNQTLPLLNDSLISSMKKSSDQRIKSLSGKRIEAIEQKNSPQKKFRIQAIEKSLLLN